MRIKNLSLLFLLILFLPIVYSFNVCNVDINEPWFLVEDDSTNKDILIVDSEGDMYLEGQDHLLINNLTEKSFQINTIFFNRITSKFNSFLQDLGSVPTDNSLVIQNNVGTNVASFSNAGNIYTKGKGVYESGQAGCPVDGNYCNGAILENRDNYCDLTGTKTGVCTFTVSGTEDCIIKPSEDFENGASFLYAGYAIDYMGCSSNSCSFNKYLDSCSGNTMTEYYAIGASYGSRSKSCSDFNTLYCSGTNVWTTNFACSSAGVSVKCSQLSDSMLQSCPATATQFGSWSCLDIDTKQRTNTVFSPQCSSGSCVSNYNPTNTSEIVDCPINNVCIDGSCSLVTCTLDGITKYVGESYTFFSSSNPSGLSCSGISQTRTCQISGSFDGNSIYNKASCLSGCSLSGVSLTSGQGWTFYSVSSSYSCASNSLSRTCTDGTLGGSSSYNLASCTPIVDCAGYWGDTSTCSASCGGGVKQQIYTLTATAQNGGINTCPSNGATWWGSTSCNTNSCTGYLVNPRGMGIDYTSCTAAPYVYCGGTGSCNIPGLPNANFYYAFNSPGAYSCDQVGKTYTSWGRSGCLGMDCR